MKIAQRTILAVLVVSGLALLSACGGGGGGSTGAAGPTLGTVITSPTVSYTIGWAQTVPLSTGATGTETLGVFPGQANKWDLGQDFTLVSGGDDQFNYALTLEVITAATSSTFLPDQTYDEMIFMTPKMDATAGVKVAAVSDGLDLYISALSGTYSAYLNSTSDSKLQQIVSLGTATGIITASWTDSVHICDGSTGYTSSYRVVAYNAATGAELAELLAVNGSFSDTDDTSETADLTAFSGQTIVLSFEQKSIHESSDDCYTVIDDVSVKDSAGSPVEFVTNGDFETGYLTPWITNTPSESQNVTTGSRDLAGLEVKRSFYTVPNKLWGRWVDLFENKLASAITATIHYNTGLGSVGYGIIYDTPGAISKSVTSWDGSGVGRDIGWVFGSNDLVSYSSETGLGDGGGSDFVDVYYHVTIQPGQKLSIVNFIVMNGTDTGTLARSVDDKATEIDTEAAKIWTDFKTDNQYRDGMTQDQINAIHNF
jgi:hypothetical protein